MKIAYRAVLLTALCLGAGASSALAETCAGVITQAYIDSLGRKPTASEASKKQKECSPWTLKKVEPDPTKLHAFDITLRLYLQGTDAGKAFAAAKLAAAQAAAVAGTPGNWNGCRGDGVHVCVDAVPSQYDRYFTNHPNCVKNTACGGQFYTCNSACPPPGSLDSSPIVVSIVDTKFITVDAQERSSFRIGITLPSCVAGTRIGDTVWVFDGTNGSPAGELCDFKVTAVASDPASVTPAVQAGEMIYAYFFLEFTMTKNPTGTVKLSFETKNHYHASATFSAAQILSNAAHGGFEWIGGWGQ